jgi:hypothetical protein
MSTRSVSVLSGTSAIIGFILLVISFSINPGPPPDPTGIQLMDFGRQFHASILWGAWLQAVAPVFIVLFALAIVYLSGATRLLSGWMTLFGACTLMTVSMIEITFYVSALFSDPPAMGLMSLHIIYAVQHLYFIVAAPSLFIPLGTVILGAKILPRIFGYLSLLLGFAFAALGVYSLHMLILPWWITTFAGIQTLWWLSAAITLIIRGGKIHIPY